MTDLLLTDVADPGVDALVEHLALRRHLAEQGDADLARAAAEAQVERIRGRTHVLDVRDGGHGDHGDDVVGRVWLVDEGDDQAVLHLHLDAAGRAASVRTALEQHARALGAARLTIGVVPGDPVTEGFVDGGGYETAAVQMRLDLGPSLPGEDVVALEPMDQATYAAWQATEIEAYAEARARSGEAPERALQVAREQHAQLLPDGLATEHHAFFVGRVDGVAVGSLWIGTERPMAFVYNVVVEEEHRRRGYGGGMMRAGAWWAREHGAHALGLNVFGYNHAARALYAALGYEVVEQFVGREL